MGNGSTGLGRSSDGGRTREGHTKYFHQWERIGRLKPNLRDMTSYPQCNCKKHCLREEKGSKIKFASDTDFSHVTVNSETSNVLAAAPLFVGTVLPRYVDGRLCKVGVANLCHHADHVVPRTMYHGKNGLVEKKMLRAQTRL